MTTAYRQPRSPRVTVDVTRDIIDTAIRQDSGHCMIADAIKQAVPGAQAVCVDIQTIRFSDPAKGFRYVYLTPRRAQLALLDFDMGEAPAPFTLQLRRAHVTPMRGMGYKRKKPISPENMEKLRANAQKARDEWNSTTLVTGGHAIHAGDDPVPSGGKPPALGALAHGSTGRPRGGVPRARRRIFGLRAMDKYATELQDSRDTVTEE